ncbi:DUF3427 domain-containing protein [Terrilactibacillus sp. BCM23-1]|uniref:DUF3427 domain-containing protein n=1 Tax=Terrilactibacillus tamarindi TaxID=2599694 RepID=A0A6N8CUJ2_9BACI|nr:DEAD/DEAH box helicase [Terrilactibacillus tamarindi]MTT31796.1 DUF3427 domain-containing protein [Terrilactibacillus tamarindi]
MHLTNKLITNSKGQTFLYELQQAFATCQRFYLSVAFINYSGLQLLLDNLKELKDRGVKGQIMTTTYLNFTDPKSLEKIKTFDNIKLKVFQTDRSTGFHTKVYIFENKDDFKIMIGSSNITQSALKSNVEWNVEIVSKEQGCFLTKVMNEYQQLWERCHDADEAFLEEYKNFIHEMKLRAVVREQQFEYTVKKKITPNIMQREAMDNLHRLRDHGEERALVISATGTGKTYMSAFDVQSYKPKTLLFIVHREEILRKAKETFEKLLGSGKMGLFTGNEKEYGKNYVFTTIQTLKDNYLLFSEDQFEYIIVDEAHHATSSSYTKVLEYFKPKFLLGMTATPERCDSGDVFGLFDNNIALEVRLNEALEENLVLPFHYFGITDIEGIDLHDVSIDNVAEVSKRLKVHKRVDFIIDKMNFYEFDGIKCKCLGFCISIDHAEYMAKEFTKRGIKSACLTGRDSPVRREEVIKQLENDYDDLQVIFSVDIFNEGVDIPSVNLVLMLRPTNSPIIFMQQLGRGLRKFEGQNFLTVLDFIGNHSKVFLIAIALSGKRFYDKDSLKVAVDRGFPDLPGATHIQMDKISQQRILEQLDQENFRAMKYLKDEYYAFKELYSRKKGNDIPYYLMDYVKYEGSPDPIKFIDNKRSDKKRSYVGFLAAVEKTPELKELVKNETFHQILIQLSSYLPLKRVYEFSILKYLVSHESITIDAARNEILKVVEDVTGDSIHHTFERLNQDFDDKRQKEREMRLCVYDSEEGILSRTNTFSEVLTGEQYKRFILDVLNYGIFRYEKKFGAKNYGVPHFKLYEQYTMIDTAILSNYRKTHSSFRGSGLVTNGKDYFLFIDLHKEEDIKETINYKDHFISQSAFQWQSPNTKSQASKQGQNIIHNKDYGIRLHLFIRKYRKLDGQSEPFIYIGTGDVYKYEGNKPITTEIALHHEIPTSLYTEFITKV